MRQITIEGGVESLNLFDGKDIFERIGNIQGIASGYNVALSYLPYSATTSTHIGGRNPEHTKQQFLALVDDMNQRGIDVIYALNGGIGHPSLIPLDTDEKEIFAHMDSNNRWGSSNKVVLADYRLFDPIRQTYDVEIIASCIQQFDKKNAESYLDKLQKYDYVVPLNHHSTINFLRQYGKYAAKLIVFLANACGSPFIETCALDHFFMERRISSAPQSSAAFTYEGVRQIIPNQLRPEEHGCKTDSAMLINREHDLEGLVGVGVPHFKVIRTEELKPGHLIRLLEVVQKLAA